MSKGIIGVASMELARYVAFEMALHALQKPGGSVLSWGIGNNIAHNYNQMIRMMLANDFEWVWLIDNDHVFEPDVLKNLLAHEVPVVCPVNVRRTTPYGPTLHNPMDAGLRQIEWADMQGWTGLVNIGNRCVGTSGMLMRREVFEKIPEPWYTNNHPRSAENLSFDLEFCDKIREAGYDIYMDTETWIGHIGEIAAWPERNDNGEWAYQLRATL